MPILGILIAIAVALFLSQGSEARDADSKAAVRTAQIAAELVRSNNDGVYDGPGGVTVANLQAVEPSLSDLTLTVTAVTATSYSVRVTSGTGNSFEIIHNADGTTDITCATAGVGGCPADGTWG
jgi:type II secretory pathway pseudopilin PulG